MKLFIKIMSQLIYEIIQEKAEIAIFEQLNPVLFPLRL